jgi:hypothetical protein
MKRLLKLMTHVVGESWHPFGPIFKGDPNGG